MTSTDHLVARYREQGFVILRDVLGASEVEAQRAGLQPYLELGVKGRSHFAQPAAENIRSSAGLAGISADYALRI